MSRTTFVAAVFLFANTKVQASQCTRGGECPSDDERRNGVSLIQTKLQTNVIEEAAMMKNVHKTSPYKDLTLAAKDGRMYHTIFSTDCSPFQHWQSYLMFHSALKVGQPGTITRIASGCSDDEAVVAREWHQEHVTNTMGDQFLLHLTPHFSNVTDKDGKTVGDYKFFNKPFGLQHWIRNAIGFDGDSGTLKNEDDVVILIDPDMVLLKPITGDFSNAQDVVVTAPHEQNRKSKVEHGSPFAQTYALGTQWRDMNLNDIAGADSPAKMVSQEDGMAFYTVGPPYLGTVRDMHSIAEKWTEFVPRVYTQMPSLMAEMYAFCIAAAHLKLPHQTIDSLMVSNVESYGEGWPMVDAIPQQNLCKFAKKPDNDEHPVPSVIHYCQTFGIGYWAFSKHPMAKDFFECESPLAEEPPENVVLENDFKVLMGGERKELNREIAQREGFMVCGVLGALNDASRFFKVHHCGDKGNMAMTLNLNPSKPE